MALKVVPAGDERCDIHNRRESPEYICETCLEEFGVESAQPVSTRRRVRRALRSVRRRGSRLDRKMLIGGGVRLLIVAVVVFALAAGGGGGGGSATGGGPPTEADVVNALNLTPDPSGAGWITSDGACWVVSILFGSDVRPGTISGQNLVEATNDEQTVGAVVTQSDFSVSEAQCVDRVGAALKAQF